MKNYNLKVWCILIPTLKAVDVKNKHFRTRHHKAWDQYVRNITGGLTIFAPSKGQWVNAENELVEERVLPVNIACTEEQIKQVVEFTVKHYEQDAIMYYKVSDDVHILKREEEIKEKYHDTLYGEVESINPYKNWIKIWLSFSEEREYHTEMELKLSDFLNSITKGEWENDKWDGPKRPVLEFIMRTKAGGEFDIELVKPEWVTQEQSEKEIDELLKELPEQF